MRFSFHTIIVPDYPNPGEYLLYNTRSQALIKIQEDLKSTVDHFRDPAYFPLRFKYAQELAELHRCGIISENDEEDLTRLRTHMNQIKNSVNTKNLFVTILTTYACNFRCVYCFESASRVNEHMSMQTAQDTIDWLKWKIKELQYQSLCLNFYGGEPLLNKPVLEYIAASMKAWCEGQGIPFKFMLQTNGYLLTPDLVDKYLGLGLSQARISVDGVGQAHDKNRPLEGGGATFEAIFKNIMAACDKVLISLSVSFDKGDVRPIERLLEYCADKGIIRKLGRFIFSPIHAALGPAGRPEKVRGAHWQCNYQQDELISSNRRIRQMMVKYGLEMKPGLSTSICPVTRREAGGTVDQQGRIFRCNSMLGHQDLSIGNVRVREYNKQHDQFLNLDAFNQCPQDCTYMPMCSGGCRLTSFLENKNFGTPVCHEPYLNEMAPEIIKQDYQRRKTTLSGAL